MTAKRTRRPGRPGRILAYLDPAAKNKTLLETLIRHAKREGAEVLAMCVLRNLPWYATVDRRRFKQIREALEHEAQARLAEDVAVLEEAGIKVRAKVAWGRPYEEIIREALRRRTQLVFKTGHPESKDESRLFGSTAMHLFRECPAPIWVVKPRRTSRNRRILVAVDPTEPAPGEVDLNVELLEWAQRLAKDEEAELHVCHAFTIMGEHLLRKRMAPHEYQQYLEDVRARVRDEMTQLLAGFGLSLEDRGVHLLKGDPGRVIPALAARKKIDLLVMGTIARTGVPGLLLGNTAERMLKTVDCSVLTLKPKGFVSPVEAD